MIYNTQLVTEKTIKLPLELQNQTTPTPRTNKKKMIKNKNGQLRNHTKKNDLMDNLYIFLNIFVFK